MRPVLRAAAANYAPDAGVVAALVSAQEISLYASAAFRANALALGVAKGVAAGVAPTAPAPVYADVPAGLARHKVLCASLGALLGNPLSTVPQLTTAVAAVLGSVDALAPLTKPWVAAVEKKRDRQYLSARGSLIQNFGQYCSYCEMPAGAGLQVEHKLPKDTWKHLAITWDNLLLCCPICNSVKGDKLPYAEYDPGQKNLIFLDAAAVRTAELASCLFPDDAAYKDFGTQYHFIFSMCVYNMSGEVTATRNLDPATFWAGASMGQFQLTGETSSYSIVSRTHAVLSKDVTTAALHDYAGTLPANTPVAINAGNKGTLPADLTALLQAIPVNDASLAAARPVPGTDLLTFLNDGTLKILKTAYYVFKWDSDPSTFSQTDAAWGNPNSLFQERRRGQNAGFLRSYYGLNLPPVHAGKAGIDPFETSSVTVTIPDRQTANVVVTWEYTVREFALGGTNYRYEVSRTDRYALDVALEGKSAASSKMLTATALRAFSPARNLKPEQSDRRVPRRTRAFFLAIKVWRDVWYASALLLIAPPAAQPWATQFLNNVLTVATDTLRASGHWTVWLTAFDQVFSGHPHRAAFRALLFTPAIMPGTEPQV